ncbi:MAG: putative LPS assembly protein LptD [Cyclobacteriaceae bacterium]
MRSFALLFFVFIAQVAIAQVEQTVRTPIIKEPARRDSLIVKVPADSTQRNPADSTKAKPRKSDINTTIFYSAKDSINSNLEDKIIRLYGDAKIKYGEIELEAENITIDYGKSLISAVGSVDTTGRHIGYPVFKDGNQTYETREMVYNFKTKKARIKEVVTKQGEGIMHGAQVFKNDKNELFSVDNAYTTCDLAHPHFRIIATRSKAIPGDKIVAGPFYMEFNDVPTPLGFLFGVFPSNIKRSSGIIVPAYGEEGVRGFFLRNGGYFFDINDHVKAWLQGDVYSKGSTALTLRTEYITRYKYQGNLLFNFTNNRTTTKIEDRNAPKDFRITWSHTPSSRGSARFSASVNAATTTFTNNNFVGSNAVAARTLDNTSRKMSSNISFSKSFPGTPISMGINLRHNQDLITKQVDLPLPDVSLNVNNLYPFKKILAGKMFWENLAFRYTMSGTNQITNNLGKIKSLAGLDEETALTVAAQDSIAPFTVANLSTFVRNGKKGFKHNIPFQSSIKILKYFTFSPSINLDQIFYFEKLNWQLDSSQTKIIVKDTVRQFNAITNFTSSLSFNTRIYGTKLFRKGSIKAIRHVINPSIGLSFQPDYQQNINYYQALTPKDSKGNTLATVYKSHHEGFIYGSSRTSKSTSLNFGINNTLELKVKGKNDSIARKIPIFNSFGINSGYNFLAPSFKLAPISMSANTNILDNKVNINFTGTLDPYVYRLDSIKGTTTQRVYQTKLDEYAWSRNHSLGQLSSVSVAFGTNLNPQARKKENETKAKIAQSNLNQDDKQLLLQHPELYVDFSIPWSMSLNYNLSYTHTGHDKAVVTQSVRFNGKLGLTEKWAITYNSGYDFVNKQLTMTNVSITRDLHCWTTSLSWVPFGKFQSYQFSIRVKAGMLKDLKLDRNRSFQDNN